jgi:hypothetical protein
VVLKTCTLEDVLSHQDIEKLAKGLPRFETYGTHGCLLDVRC